MPESASLPVRALELEREDVVALVRTAVAAGAGIWIIVKGTSMVPAIPAQSPVHLVALPHGGPRRGDVVLAIRDSGSPMLHRVLRVSGRVVVLKGDNLYQPDHRFDLGSVIAVADLVMIDGRTVRIDERPRPSWLVQLRQLRQRVVVLLSRLLHSGA